MEVINNNRSTVLILKKEKVETMNRKIIFSIVLISFTTIASAQLKIGYILSERIRSEYEEFKEAESQLQLEYRKVQFEFDERVKKLDSLKQDYEVKRLMSLDKGESIKQEIEQTERQIQTYQAEKVGPQGELMRKQAQMEYDILGKVKKAVDKVAINGGYDYIIDASVGLLYYKPKYDLTDDVLHELRKLDTSK
jgi:Skp family chaperone for outer membrane proteins